MWQEGSGCSTSRARSASTSRTSTRRRRGARRLPRARRGGAVDQRRGERAARVPEGVRREGAEEAEGPRRRRRGRRRRGPRRPRRPTCSTRGYAAARPSSTTFTLADLGYLPYLQELGGGSADLIEARPGVAAWWARCSARPAWQEVPRWRRTREVARGGSALGRKTSIDFSETLPRREPERRRLAKTRRAGSVALAPERRRRAAAAAPPQPPVEEAVDELQRRGRRRGR